MTVAVTQLPPPCPIYTSGGTAKGSYCVFPFQAFGRTFYQCTREYTSSNREWCATTSNYADNLWGYCEGQSTCIEGNEPQVALICPFKCRDMV